MRRRRAVASVAHPDEEPAVRAIRITEFGGPEVLTYVEDAPEPEALRRVLRDLTGRRP